MEETRYMISDAAKQVGVETHVLRNWEEELELQIGRTELGHRYYTGKTIDLFQKVKELREKGFQLKAIKVLIPEIQRKNEAAEEARKESVCEEQKAIGQAMAGERVETVQTAAAGTDGEHALTVLMDLDKIEKFEEMVGSVVRQALMENNIELENRISDTVVKEMELLMQIREEREEERYRNLDETIRMYQKKRQMVAAAREGGVRRKWFQFLK